MHLEFFLYKNSRFGTQNLKFPPVAARLLSMSKTKHKPSCSLNFGLEKRVILLDRQGEDFYELGGCDHKARARGDNEHDCAVKYGGKIKAWGDLDQGVVTSCVTTELLNKASKKKDGISKIAGSIVAKIAKLLSKENNCKNI